MRIERITHPVECHLPILGVRVAPRLITPIAVISEGRKPVLHQTSRLGDLLDGHFCREGITPEHVSLFGDFGLGACGLNFGGGEGLILGGQHYSMPHPREVYRLHHGPNHLSVQQTPFTMITRFDPDQAAVYRMAEIESYDAFKGFLSELSRKGAKHRAVMVQGEFQSLRLQNVQRPHARGLDFAHVRQEVDCFENRHATLGGFFLGDVDARTNKPGAHFHGIVGFAASRFEGGGHILDMNIREVLVFVQELGGLEVLVP